MKKPFLPLALLLLLGGCSVKEDRSACPCLLSVVTRHSFERTGASAGWVLTIAGYADEGKEVEETLGPEEMRDTLEYDVPKGSVRLIGLLSAGTSRSAADGFVRIPPGSQAEPLFACSDTVDTRGETACYILLPHKQFSEILLKDAGGGIPFPEREAELSGSVCGFDLHSLQPLPGSFRCRGERIPEPAIRFRIPRQASADLELTFPPASGAGSPIRLPLGKMLFEAGYDPWARDLPDYVVRIETAALSPQVTVLPWSLVRLDVIL